MKKNLILITFFLFIFNLLCVSGMYSEEENWPSLPFYVSYLQANRTPTLKFRDKILVPEIEELKYNGFIVTFPEKPVLLYKKDLIAKGETKEKIDSLVAAYKSNLVLRHDSIKQKFPGKVGNDFYDVFNGLTLYITEQECQDLVKQGLVQACFKNFEVKAMLNESVPLIRANQVWLLRDPLGRNITGQNVTIAIIDTGVDYTHPDLDEGKVVQEHCYCYPDCCPNNQSEMHGPGAAMDDHGHGTHCASIAAGTGEASNGLMKGVAPDAKIVAIKVLNRDGYGYESDIIAGIERAVQDNVSIISMSLGGRVLNDCYDWALSNVSDNAVDLGVSVVVAAGNDGPGYATILAPGCAKKVITVGASDKKDQIASFSSRGPTNDFRVKPDVVAPGVDICAARYSNAWPGRECYGNNYVSLSGTSMATPHVAGLVALIKQKNPTWTPDEIKHALRNNAIKLIEPELNIARPYDILTQGYGRVDALASVLSAKPPIARLDTYGIVNGTIPILGYAYADNFKGYRLEYGQGVTPTNWTLLIESQTLPTSGVLYRWNTNLTRDGLYTLRLTIIDRNNGKSLDQSLIIIANNPNREFNCSSCFECTYFGMISGSNIFLTRDIITSNSGICIQILGDNITFNCKNHKIDSLLPPWNPSEIGIYSMSDGIQIVNCRINNFWAGILLEYPSKNIAIFNNTFQNDTYGIFLGGVRNATLSNNHIIKTPEFDPWYSQGIDVWGSGIYSDHKIDTSNTINGKPIHYFYNIHDKEIKNLESGGIKLHSSFNITLDNISVINGDGIQIKYSNNNTIKNSKLSKNFAGIYVRLSNNNLIKNNEIFNNQEVGIYGERRSYRNKIIGNNIFSNMSYPHDTATGIGLFEFFDTEIENNTITNILYWGVALMWSNNTTIKRNQISFNRGIGISIWYDYNYNFSYHRIFENNITYNRIYGIQLVNSIPLNLILYHNNIYGNGFQIFDDGEAPIQISWNRQGNYWGRSEYPYFCEYGNMNKTCVDNWDSNRPDVIDSCPYNQSYPPGQWPPSPVCPLSPCEQHGGICMSVTECPEEYAEVDLSCETSETEISKTTGKIIGKTIFIDLLKGVLSRSQPQPSNKICCMKLSREYQGEIDELFKKILELKERGASKEEIIKNLVEIMESGKYQEEIKLLIEKIKNLDEKEFKKLLENEEELRKFIEEVFKKQIIEEEKPKEIFIIGRAILNFFKKIIK